MSIINSFKIDKSKKNQKDEGNNLKYKNEKETKENNTKEKKIALEENITNSIKKKKKKIIDKVV